MFLYWYYSGILEQSMGARNRVGIGLSHCAGILEQSMGARNRVEIGFSYCTGNYILGLGTEWEYGFCTVLKI